MVSQSFLRCLALLVLAGMGVVACAGAPVQEMSNARQAIKAARDASGELSAPPALVEAALAGQEGRWEEAARLFGQALPGLDRSRQATAAYGRWFARSLADPDRSEPPPEGTRLAGSPERLTDDAFDRVEALERYARERGQGRRRPQRPHRLGAAPTPRMGDAVPKPSQRLVRIRGKCLCQSLLRSVEVVSRPRRD